MTREELYELVWATPTSHRGTRFGLSDAGLAKFRKKLDTPRPPVGYTSLTFHSVRHSADSILKHLGVGDHVIDAQLGWQSGAGSTMHRHYATAFEEDLIDAAKRLTDALLGTDPVALGATVGATR